MNVLLILCDQLQAKCLGFMGHPVVQTPHLDRLAGESVVFDNAFVQVPVSLGSRSCILTGRYPEANGARSMSFLGPQERTLAEDLLRGGFDTALFGKLHLTPQLYTGETFKTREPVSDWRRFKEAAHLLDMVDDPARRHYGFAERVECEDSLQGSYEAWVRERMDRPKSYRDGEAGMKKHRAGAALVAEGRRPPSLFPGQPHAGVYVSPVPSELHHSSFIADQTEAFIRRRDADSKPWFAFCSFLHPHHPFDAPQDQIDRYSPGDITLPPTNGEPSADEVPSRIAGAIGQFAKVCAEAQRMLIHHYYASISLIDDCIGRLRAALEETGQLENTIIAFGADHGEMLGSHGLLTKPTYLYDELIRVPLFIRVPRNHAAGNTTPRRIDGMVEMVDLYPTLLGLLDRPIHPGVQGINWTGPLLGGEAFGRQEIHCESFGTPFDMPGIHTCKAQCLRTAKWKLNVYIESSHEHGQLFDLVNDPNESTNLYHDASHRDIREELMWRLLRKKNAQADPLPIRLSQW